MNRMLQAIVTIAGVGLLATGCAHMPGHCDLGKAAKDAQLQNVTTGDGTFENYQATGYYTGTEVGLAIGIPFIGKLMELYPTQDDTAQMTQIARDAKSGGATAVINAHPPRELYTGFPLFFVGIYVDSAAGTGIKSK